MAVSIRKLPLPSRERGGVGEKTEHFEILSRYHPHPLNHVRFRALSCTLRGAGLSSLKREEKNCIPDGNQRSEDLYMVSPPSMART